MTNVRRPAPQRTAAPRFALLLVAALLGLSACAPAPDPMLKAVAILDGKALTVADLEGYLRDNLAEEDAGEPVPSEDLDRVKSRLYENFIDEEVLLAEARRRGVQVTPEELRSYLDSGAAEGSAGAAATAGEDRKLALRDLTIQKLREARALLTARVTPAEVDAYLARNREALRARPRVVLRSFTLASPAEAERSRSKILRMKRKLDQATASGEDLGPEGGRLQEVPVESLPDEARKALAKLEPGQVSPAVMLEGVPYLFYYQSGPADRPDTEEALRARAEDALRRDRMEEGSMRFLEALKRNARIELHPENLPFRYVPEDARPAAAGAPVASGQD